MEVLGTPSSGSMTAFSSDLAKRSFFLYRYDGQGRVIESQVPDGGVSESTSRARYNCHTIIRPYATRELVQLPHQNLAKRHIKISLFL